MTYMLVRHKVADFEAWQRVFDSHAEAQQKAGLRIARVLRNLDDPSEVFLFFEVTNLEGARAFVAAPEVPAAQEASGVLDEPDVFFLG